VFDTVSGARSFNEVGTIPEGNIEGLDESHNNSSQALIHPLHNVGRGP